MNTILSDYMNYGIQMSTQKRVNNPSDDPTGTVHILNYRASININATYIDNSKEASAWLKKYGRSAAASANRADAYHGTCRTSVLANVFS